MLKRRILAHVGLCELRKNTYYMLTTASQQQQGGVEGEITADL